MRLTGVGVALVIGASAQSLIDPEQQAAAQSAFDDAGAARMHCEFHPRLPALDYSLRFQTGFRVDIPLKELNYRNHELTVYMRVTPDGRPPVYLAMSGSVRNTEGIQGDAELTGEFAVGEGSYAVEALVEDEEPRICYSHWRIQPELSPAERELKTVTPAGAVEEARLFPDMPAPPAPPAPQIARLTVLVHASSLGSSTAGMEPGLVAKLAESLHSILTQLPARSVRLILFNLDKNAVLLTKDPFRLPDLAEVVSACERLQLFAVSVKDLQRHGKADVLSHLVVQEMRDPRPASAFLLIGPRTQLSSDPPALDGVSPPAVPWFYLQYLPPPARPVRAFGPNGRFGGWMGPRGNTTGFEVPSAAPPAATLPAAAPLKPDSIERLVGVLNGSTLPISSPHDLAIAIGRLRAGIPASVTASAGTEADSSQPPPPSLVENGAGLRPLSGNEDPVELLGSLYDRVAAYGREVPNHTCVETVQRNWYQLRTDEPIRSCASLLTSRKLPGHRLQLRSTDWLRLDVGVAGGHEIFSWAGSARFEEGEFDELIPKGAFGTGPFATILLSVLDNRDSLVTLDGETAVDGRRVLQYSYRVPRQDSLYRVKAGQDWVATGYAGTLLVDPETSNLVRFSVRTDELPPATQTCEIETTLDYDMVELGSFQYLLPVSSRQRFVGVNGNEDENTLSFNSCREFRGESTIAFDNSRARAVAPAAASPAPILPPGSRLLVELATAIEFGKAAAGDLIEGRLAVPLRDSAGRILAAAGARVDGRLTRVELRQFPEPEYILSLRWETLEVAGAHIPLNLKPDPQSGTYRFPRDHSATIGALRTEWVIAGGHR